MAIHYAIRPADLHGHYFDVRCTIKAPDPAGQVFALPAWIPGSYLIRDFARHIVAISAEAGAKPVALTKIDKHSWQAAPIAPGAPLTVSCRVYAFDLSVRGAHVDASHAFFNGSSVFLRPVGFDDAPCLLDLLPPASEECRDWQVATSLAPARGEEGCAKAHGFGRYRAANYAELIDHPVEMGRPTLIRFKACGVPHQVAISGRHDCDGERLAADLAKICAWQIGLFGEPAPMKRYSFLVSALGSGYGGLEHRAACALICARSDLPYVGMDKMSEGYLSFLGLCSHEYFHSWNVKRIRPAAFANGNLERENYTQLLWAFEGITSYYDDLTLLKSGVITLDDYLALLAKTMSRVQAAPGRLRQSLAESSFDAWIKFYHPDENTPNAVVSYYAKGALVALALDLTLRLGTRGRVALDDLMRELWRKHGQTGVGVGEDGIRTLAEEISGLDFGAFFAANVHGTGELPLADLLAKFGVTLAWEAGKTPSLGAKTSNDGNEVKLATVFEGGAAHAAGLAAGDVVVAIDGLRVTPSMLDAELARRKAGTTISVHAFRRDELVQVQVRLAPAPAETAKLTLAARGNRLRQEWLGA